MAPPPHTNFTPKKRKLDNLTSNADATAGNDSDSDSDYNPRNRNHKLMPKTKPSKTASRNQSFVQTSTLIPLQSLYPYLNDNNNQEESSNVQLPTPPKISLFLKFGKKAKTGKKSAMSSSRDLTSGHGLSEPMPAFISPQGPSSPASTCTQLGPGLIHKPMPTTKFISTFTPYGNRRSTGSLPSTVVGNYTEVSASSLDNSDFVTHMLGPATTLKDHCTAAKGRLGGGQKRTSDSTGAPNTPPVKPSGIKLRFNIKSKTHPAKEDSCIDDSEPSVVPSADTSRKKKMAPYKVPTLHSDKSSLKTRYQSSPVGSLSTSGSKPSSSRASFLRRLSSSKPSQQSTSRFSCRIYKELTLEDRLMSALHSEMGSSSEAMDTASLDSDSGSDWEIDADILAEVAAEEAEMNSDINVQAVRQEWKPSADLSYALNLADDQELIKTAEKLYWLGMEARWAERGGVEKSFLNGLVAEITHLEGLKLRLEQKLSFIPILGVHANDPANNIDGGQTALQARQKKLPIPSMPKNAPSFSTSPTTAR